MRIFTHTNLQTSQFMGFFMTFSILVILLRLRGYNNLAKAFGCICSIGLSLAVCYSRLLFGFHTFEQVCSALTIVTVRFCETSRTSRGFASIAMNKDIR